MFFKLLAAFTLVPIVELLLLIEVGRRIGSLQTIFIVLATGVVGAYLARSEGMAVFHRVRDKLNRGDIPDGELLDGLFILIGGALLLTPGLLTDILGFTCLLPPTRGGLKRWVRKRATIWIERRW